MARAYLVSGSCHVTTGKHIPTALMDSSPYKPGWPEMGSMKISALGKKDWGPAPGQDPKSVMPNLGTVPLNEA